MTDTGHIPVLQKDVIATLEPNDDDIILDLTAGRGGHAELLARHCKPKLVLLFDLDKENLDYARARVESQGVEVQAFHANFATAANTIMNLGISANIVLADLGVASNQLKQANRGLSFMHEGPLDMRLNPESGNTAADLVQNLDENELADLIYTLGEDPFARQIARKIVFERQKEPILDTVRLAKIVRASYGFKAKKSRLNPATRTFMALRIAVNNELVALDALLKDVEMGCRKVGKSGWLSLDARIGVISFHSLEDRRVKQAFVSLEKKGIAKRITRKPIQVSDEEAANNPRARSAKLRVIKVAQRDL